MNYSHPPLLSPEKKRKKAVRARYQERLKSLSPEEKFERDQRLLWHRVHSVFTKIEYISYQNLPEELRVQLQPFEEFTYPH